jgi:GNAT superfamily N-acetyltransferase
MGLRLKIRDLTPSLWPAMESLFGERGACGGCWCMYWRLEKGERWDDLKGAPARARMRALVKNGKSQGALAFVDDEPVGWCAYGRRTDLVRLERARTLACADAEHVWSIPCFFVKAGWRDKGVASALLDHAVKSLRRRGAKIVEGYPVNLKAGARLPNAFAYTGTPAMFTDAGFTIAGSGATSKVRMRRNLK